MIKNKGVLYTFILTIVLFGGLVLMVFNKDTEHKMTSEIGVEVSDGLQTDEKLSFQKSIGEVAPDFSLESIKGGTINLSDNRGKMVVLFFNEGSMCYPACWNQITEFADDERFNNDDTQVFSIVIDPRYKWDKIVNETQGFSNAQILFDTNKKVSYAYDVLSLNSSMHKGTNPGHTYFVIDTEGVVRYVFDDPNMAIRNDLIFSELSKIRGE